MHYCVDIFLDDENLIHVDQLTLEFAGVYRHYHSALMRTIPIGKAKHRAFGIT